MPERLSEIVREFATNLLSPYDRDAILHGLLGRSIVALDAAGSGIMLTAGPSELAFAAASDDRVEPVEQVQAESATGVCYEAYRTGQVVAVADLMAEERWPEYAKRALEQGFVAVIGVPLVAWGQTVGVLNLYREAPCSWSDGDVEACQVLAAMGAAYILGAEQARSQQELSEQLYAALRSRGVIERAKGIIMASQHVDAQAAFQMLRDASMRDNKKLRDIAAIVAEHGWKAQS